MEQAADRLQATVENKAQSGSSARVGYDF